MPKPRPPIRPAVVVHGGAWAIPDPEWRSHREGVRAAAREAWKVISDGGSAVDAVQAAIVVLEEDLTFDAGTGSVLTRDGHVEMDASLMCGRNLDVGSVACVREVKNPILLAREVLKSDHVLLSGDGAHRFARDCGVPTCDPKSLVIDRERQRLAQYLKSPQDVDPRAPFGHPAHGPTGTVGAVAVDKGGNVAAGGSTGGMTGKNSGRIGDTPIPGAGLWADNRWGGAACTGWGEGILRVGLARTAVANLRDSAAQDAAWLAVREMDDRIQGRAGVIVLSRDGSIGFAFNTPRMAVAYMDEEMIDPFVNGETRG
jgi:beta-aspartyl-peptidase (threonine type)